MKNRTLTRQTFFYAVIMAALLFLLKWLEVKLLILSHAFEIYAGAIAVLFTLLGIWLASKIIAPKTHTVYLKAENIETADSLAAAKLGISARELEVLALIAKGHTNAEIGTELCVSTNTVKTHVSNLFAKLDSGKRVQALEKARQLGILSSPESVKNAQLG